MEEFRWLDSSFEVRGADSDGVPVLRARFAHWDRWNHIREARGEFLEMPVRGATDQTFAEQGESVRALFDHGKDPSVGMRTLGAFKSYENTDEGPVAEFELFTETSHVRDLMPGIMAGTYGLSYRFGIASPEDEVWDYSPGESEHNPRGLPERSILKSFVAEVSVTPFPADRATNGGGALSVRSLIDRYGAEDRCVDSPESEASVPVLGAVTTDRGGALRAVTLNRELVLARFRTIN